MIDTHCHLTFPEYEGRIDAVLAAAGAAGVRGCVTVSTTPADARRSLAIAERYANVWSTAGVHPLHADELTGDGAAEIEGLLGVARSDRCVAWGELGLDRHYSRPPIGVQRAVLDRQLELIERARGEVDKPVVIHCREAFSELIPILAGTSIAPERFVFHCFTGGPAEMELVLAFGAWASFTGVLTYRNAADVREAAAMIPSDRVMVETDAPFLTPEPHRGERPNEPRHVVHVARVLAEAQREDPGAFERRLDANAERFFGITLP